jgi:2-desacetyl-2-hydroxyethyl bacteriochlorophyllide A dehydrogenase
MAMEMMAMRLYGPNDMRYERISVPELGPNDVRVKVTYCGICGTDEEFYFGTSSFYKAGLIRLPMTLGHECSGIVDAVGESVRQVKVGDRIVLDSVVACGQCVPCKFGKRQQCKELRCVGTINCVDGGYAEYVVMPERGVFLLPDTVSLESGALIEPLSISLYAVERANIAIGDTILVAGTGAIGLGAIPFIRERGAKTIIVMGRKDYKLDAAKKLGADITVNITRESLKEVILNSTDGNGVDCILEATGSPEVLNNMIELAAYDARISVPSFYGRAIDHFPIDQSVLKNISMHFVFSNADTYPRVIKMLASGKLDVSCLITHRYPLSEAIQALNDMRNRKEGGIKYLLSAGGSDVNEFPTERKNGRY